MYSRLIITSILLLILCSCTNNQASNKTENNEQQVDVENDKKTNKKESTFWQKMTMHEIKDNSGMVAAILPLPSNWKLHTPPQNGVSITGPNNIKITDFAPKNYMMTDDQNMQYAASQGGIQIKPLQSIEQIIEQDLIPSATKKGLNYIKHYELPNVSKLDKWYADQMYRTAPTQLYNKVYAVDMKYNDGRPALVVIHVSSTRTQYMENWYHMASLLDADASVFETAKKQYIFAIENMRYNIEPILAYNKAEAQRIGQSWANFNAKMKASQAAFEANQIAHVNKSNAINDAIMSGWKAQNAASDKNQEQFVDYIYENQNVQNTETGTTYKVQQGSNQYWMNNNGEYIGTKSNTYNPNLDDNMNEDKWQELKKLD